MKKLLVSFLSIGFISATCIFVSCSKKKEDPAPTPVATTTTGGTTTGGSTTGTTSGTTSGTTTSGTMSNGSFNDETTNYSNAFSSAFSSPADTSILTINITPTKTGSYPVVILSLKRPIETGTFTATSGHSGGITYNSISDQYYTSSNGGSFSVTISSVSASQITGTFTFAGKEYGGTVTKNVTGSFNTSIRSSGSTTSGTTTSGTTSGSTTTGSDIKVVGSGTGSYNDGTNRDNLTSVAFESGTNPIATSINIGTIGSPYPSVTIKIKKPHTTGTFFSSTSSPDYYGGIFYSTNETYITLNGGSNTITITTASATKLVGNFSFSAKNDGGTITKNVTGSFNINLN